MVNSSAVMTAPLMRGSLTRSATRTGPAPSIVAASSTSRGTACSAAKKMIML